MLKGRFNYPDLDILDSPSLSPTPGSSFSAIPPSALADRIFNDPESWGEDDADDSDFPEDVNDIAWLAEELEKVVQSAGVDTKGAFNVQAPIEKARKFINTPASAIQRNVQASIKRDAGATLFKGTGKKGSIRPISLAALFEHSNEDFSGEIQQQLSKILESGGILHHIRSFPNSSALSPPSTSGTTSSLNTPLQIHTGSNNFNGGENSPSPINVYSASATLSFLEWYGIYPDSPRLDLNSRRSTLQPKSARPKTPMLQVPSPRHAVRTASWLNTPIASESLGLPAGSKRASSVPPPGLDIPSNVTETRPVTTPPTQARTPSPEPQSRHKPATRTTGGHLQYSRSDLADSKRGRTEALGAPPPYSQTALPHPPISVKTPDVVNTPKAKSRSRDATLSRTSSGMSRRLPTIPPSEAMDISRTSTPPPAPAPAVAAAQAPPAPRQRAPSRSGTPANASRSNTPPQALASSVLQYTPVRNTTPSPMMGSGAQAQAEGALRPVSSIRSPQGGPAGPRTRGRGSRDSANAPGTLRQQSLRF